MPVTKSVGITRAVHSFTSAIQSVVCAVSVISTRRRIAILTTVVINASAHGLAGLFSTISVFSARVRVASGRILLVRAVVPICVDGEVARRSCDLRGSCFAFPKCFRLVFARVWPKICENRITSWFDGTIVAGVARVSTHTESVGASAMITAGRTTRIFILRLTSKLGCVPRELNPINIRATLTRWDVVIPSRVITTFQLVRWRSAP